MQCWFCFVQAEDGIRYYKVTGVQTCALPIWPQRAFIALLASGYSPVYPCHVTPAQMRSHPIGTGPFKFVEFKPNEHIKVTRNSDYWKQGRPYLDGIEYKIIPNVSTRLLSFVSGKFDFLPGVSIPLLKDVKKPGARRNL